MDQKNKKWLNTYEKLMGGGGGKWGINKNPNSDQQKKNLRIKRTKTRK